VRDLSVHERDFMRRVAERLDAKLRAQLLEDIDCSHVASALDRDSRILFCIDGYDRPPYKGQYALPVEARMLDSDGTDLTVVLYADENGRLLELEFVRWGEGGIVDPRWETLQLW
jgi:hypothetical protein